MTKSDAGEQEHERPDEVVGLAQAAERDPAEHRSADRLPGPFVSYIHSVSWERNTVGAIALTLIACGPHSQASALVSPSIAALEGQ